MLRVNSASTLAAAVCESGRSLAAIRRNGSKSAQDVVSLGDKIEGQTILFGSHARGDAGPESDVDFLVVESGPFDQTRSRRAELVRLWKALAHFMVAKDILVDNTEEVEQWRGSVNHVVANALREGKVLYERH